MSVPRLQHVESGAWLDLGLNAGAEGGALYTSGARSSFESCEIGDPAADVQKTVFSNLDGVCTTRWGLRERIIVVSGHLRLTTAQLKTVLATREAWQKLTGRMLFVDDLDIEYDDCRLVELLITHKQKLLSGAGLDWIVPFRLTVEQQLV